MVPVNEFPLRSKYCREEYLRISEDMLPTKPLLLRSIAVTDCCVLDLFPAVTTVNAQLTPLEVQSTFAGNEKFNMCAIFWYVGPDK